MNPVVLLMLMALLGADAAVGAFDPLLSGWAMPAAALGPLVVIAAGAWLVGWRVCRTLDRQPQRAARAIEVARITMESARWACLLVFVAAAHALGWVTWLVHSTGVPLIIADVLAVAPALVAVAFTWWAYHPIDLRVRQASLVGHLDTGQPIGGGWTRGRYTLWQVRHQMALFVAMLGILLAWRHAVEAAIVTADAPQWIAHAATLVGGLLAFAAAPLLIRLLWDTEPLAAGPLRDRLVAMCAAHGVRFRRLLVWRTCGGIINAAVVGFAAPLRYIVVTDGMIERLDDAEVEAVMAHEIAHVVRRHLPWMLICAIALLAGAILLVDTLTQATLSAIAVDLATMARPVVAAIDGFTLLLILGIWATLFGVVSRRMERQADTFAAQHLASQRIDPDAPAGVIGPSAAGIVADTLHRIAVLNRIPTRRRAWRHGSIASRVAYLRSLVGTPIDACPIDSLVRRTCYSCLLLLIVAMLAMTYLDGATTI